MSEKLFQRAIEATIRFCERKGMEILDTRWRPSCGGEAIDLVALDDATIVFIGVTVSDSEADGFQQPRLSRAESEILAAKWLAENEPAGDVPIRFDQIDILVVNEARTRALLRHHRSAFDEA